MNARFPACYVPVLAMLAGCCANPGSNPQSPKPLTLEEALSSVVAGLNSMQQSPPPDGYQPVGLIPSDAEVVFKISTTEADKKKVYVELSAPGSAIIGAKAGGESSREVSAERANTITIHFKNVLFTDEKALLAAYDKKKIGELFEKLGWVILAR